MRINEELLNAVKNRGMNEISAALKKGADVNYEAETGMSPLSYAQGENDLEIAKVLLENGADVNYRYQSDQLKTVLHFAAMDEQYEMLKLLIAFTPDINVRDVFGNNPLWTAAYTNNLDMIELLLKHGADAFTQNRVGEILVGKNKMPIGKNHSPYSAALEDDYQEQVELFKKYGNEQ